MSEAITASRREVFRPDIYDGKPRYLGGPERRVMEEVLGTLREQIKGLTDADLSLFVRGCTLVSPANCGWDVFKLAELAYWCAVDEQDARARHAMAEKEG